MFNRLAMGMARSADKAIRDSAKERQRQEQQSLKAEQRRLEEEWKTLQVMSKRINEAEESVQEYCLEHGFDSDGARLYLWENHDDLISKGQSAISEYVSKHQKFIELLETYLKLGGKPTNLKFYNEVEEYISKLKYLSSVGCLDYQDDAGFQSDESDMRRYLEMDISLGLFSPTQVDTASMSGTDFEQLCQVLLSKMGFETEITKASGDGGIDIIAYNRQPILAGKYIVQCKRYSGSVGEPVIRDLYGVVTSERANKGILITTGSLTRQARTFAEGKPLELIDGAQLNQLIEQYGLGVSLTSQSGVRYRDISEEDKGQLLGHLETTYSSLLEMLGNFDDWGQTSLILEAFHLDNAELTIRELVELEFVGYVNWLLNDGGSVSGDEGDLIRRTIGKKYSNDGLTRLASLYPLGDAPQVPYTALLVQFAGNQMEQDSPEEMAINFYEMIGGVCALLIDCEIEKKRSQSIACIKRVFS